MKMHKTTTDGYGTGVKLARTLSPTLLLFAALISLRCGSFRLSGTLLANPGDWPTSGHDNARTCTSSDAISPPLVRDWLIDISAGVGSGSPILVDSTIVVGTLRGELLVVAQNTGSRIASMRLGDAIAGSPAVIRHGLAIPLTGTDQSIAAYNTEIGSLQWKRNDGAVEMSPLAQHGRLYYGTLDGTLLCVNDSDGTLIWKYNTTVEKNGIGFRANPASTDSLIVFGGNDGTVYALSAMTGTLRWRTDAGGPIVGGLVMHNRFVAVGTTANSVTAFDSQNGVRLWTVAVDGPVYAAPAVIGDTIVVGTLAGTVYAICVANGSIAWRTNVGGPVNSAAAVSGQGIYLGTLDRQIIVLERSGGHIVWNETVNGRIKTAPAIGYGRIFVATDERELMAYKEAPR